MRTRLRKYLGVAAAGLALGFVGAWVLRVQTRTTPESSAASENVAIRNRIQQLENELVEARRLKGARQLAPPVEAPLAPPKVAELSRLQAFRMLNAQGASISVAVFDGRTFTGMAQSAKDFFGLTEEEAARASEVMAAARRAVDLPTAQAIITATTGDSVTVTIPSAGNSKEIRDRMAFELAVAIGSERAEELMEIGGPELDRVLRGYGSRERTITITRIVAPTNPPPGMIPMQFRLSESFPNGGMGTSFNNPAEKEEFAWLAKFNSELEALVATGR